MPLDGAGAGAAEGPSAITALKEAAAKMTAQATFFISIATKARSEGFTDSVTGGVGEEGGFDRALIYSGICCLRGWDGRGRGFIGRARGSVLVNDG